MLEAEIKPNQISECTGLWMNIMSTENPVALIFPKKQFESVLNTSYCLYFWILEWNLIACQGQKFKIDDVMVSSTLSFFDIHSLSRLKTVSGLFVQFIVHWSEVGWVVCRTTIKFFLLYLSPSLSSSLPSPKCVLSFYCYSMKPFVLGNPSYVVVLCFPKFNLSG